MAIVDIPTGIIPEEIVESLPETGQPNKVYRRLVEDEELREMQITDDFIWYDGEWHPFSFEAKICGAFFERYQNSVAETVAEMEQVIAEQNAYIEELEHEVFPASAVTFNMSITSEFETTMDLIDPDGYVIPGSGIYTEIWTDHNLAYEDNLKRGTYYLRNATRNLILADAFGKEVPLKFMGNTPVEVGSVIVTEITPQKKGGKK